MLSWGVFAVVWTLPDDQGGIVNAVLNGEYESAGNGNGTIIRPGFEGQFIMDYQIRIPAGIGSGTSLPPSGVGFVFGPLLWTTPSLTISSFEVRYALFTFEFSSQLGPAPPLWFSGSQGNLTASLVTTKYGGVPSTRPFSNFQTSIFELAGPGNYTLHYFNSGTVNATGLVAMGPSSVLFSRPYLYAGVTTIVLALTFSVVTRFVLVRVRKPATAMPGAGAVTG
jgi:hypothetical protein